LRLLAYSLFHCLFQVENVETAHAYSTCFCVCYKCESGFNGDKLFWSISTSKIHYHTFRLFAIKTTKYSEVLPSSFW